MSEGRKFEFKIRVAERTSRSDPVIQWGRVEPLTVRARDRGDLREKVIATRHGRPHAGRTAVLIESATLAPDA